MGAYRNLAMQHCLCKLFVNKHSPNITTPVNIGSNSLVLKSGINMDDERIKKVLDCLKENNFG